MPVEETGETRVRMDFLISMFPYAYKLKNKFQLEKEGIGNIFWGDFKSR